MGSASSWDYLVVRLVVLLAVALDLEEGDAVGGGAGLAKDA
ncbi:MAG: hypothetical protein QOE89_3822, partial [Pseudonocardiales bacterium]|nr:hypothetical protein [Pseudonocardiales bacterium]